MIPALTPTQMRTADAVALASAVSDDVFIARAGYAVAHVARTMMNGCYGRRVTLIAGHGHNGDDGRVAARWLRDWGAQVSEITADNCEGVFVDPRTADLVIDAAYGIGFRGEWTPPIVFDVPVLAVDLPSGLNALDGSVAGGVLVADRTITFAAPKTGMLLGHGPDVCGDIDVVDVGIDVDIDGVDLDTFIVEPSDVRAWLAPRARESHKWDCAVRAIAGSPGMAGAAALVSAAAMRAGAGMVHLSWRGDDSAVMPPTEVVGRHLPAENWAQFVRSDASRFAAMVIGPGLGRGDDVAAEVRTILREIALPTVVDGDGIIAAVDPEGTHHTLHHRGAETLLTPHDGEFALLGGDVDNPDRIAATRALAAATGCTVLRKGPTTIISDPDGAVYLCVAGDQRLATAGTGDVLAGIAAAFIARGLGVPEAAAAAAMVHAMAGSRCSVEGTIARDVVASVSDVLSDIMNESADRSSAGGRHVG